MARSGIELCVRREVETLRTGRDSKAVPWLRRLLTDVVRDGRPCGVVGMCMTGGFALALAVDPAVRAAVVAQPAVPLYQLGTRVPLPGKERRKADLGLSPATQDMLRSRLRDDPACLRARGYRFSADPLSPAERLQSAEAPSRRCHRGHVPAVGRPAPPLHADRARRRRRGGRGARLPPGAAGRAGLTPGDSPDLPGRSSAIPLLRWVGARSS